MRSGRQAARRDREEAAAEGSAPDEPSTTILIDSGYTPAPASVADTRTGSPAATLGVRSRRTWWLHVVDPVAERERAGAGPRRAVEDGGVLARQR